MQIVKALGKLKARIVQRQELGGRDSLQAHSEAEPCQDWRASWPGPHSSFPFTLDGRPLTGA